MARLGLPGTGLFFAGGEHRGMSGRGLGYTVTVIAACLGVLAALDWPYTLVDLEELLWVGVPTWPIRLGELPLPAVFILVVAVGLGLPVVAALR